MFVCMSVCLYEKESRSCNTRLVPVSHSDSIPGARGVTCSRQVGSGRDGRGNLRCDCDRTVLRITKLCVFNRQVRRGKDVLCGEV